MVVKCIHNTGDILLNYERIPFGTNEHTQYGQLEKGKQYLVTGMILGEGILNYLIDDGGIISACPYQLFEVVTNDVPVSWHYKPLLVGDNKFPYLEAIWGYHELVFDDLHYEKLIEGDEESKRIYFKRKIELEKEISS